jgi:hypothetical protein
MAARFASPVIALSIVSAGTHYRPEKPIFRMTLDSARGGPIKPPYIKSFVGLCDAHIAKVSKEETHD